MAGAAGALAQSAAPDPSARPADEHHLTAREVTQALFTARPGAAIDLSARSLTRLDLARLDFKQARLAGADLFGTDLTGSDLSGSDLSHARLDRTVLIGTRFSRANLERATLLRPATSAGLQPLATEALQFDGANLRSARLFGRFMRANFRDADLTGATLAPFGRTGFIEHIWRSELVSADFTRARLARANLDKSLLAFARLHSADLSGSSLREADLTGADLTDADFTNADLTGAILRDAVIIGARFTGAKGIEPATGRDTAAPAPLPAGGDQPGAVETGGERP
ncbi:MAG: pentapeptide repeat-containing protein [Hyphomicrobiaceae bacterium]|nr:pentapeptide repeat-containing protein [Hyphomicrobiaceae bacterium]